VSNNIEGSGKAPQALQKKLVTLLTTEGKRILNTAVSTCLYHQDQEREGQYP